MSIKIDTSDFLPDLEHKLRKVVEEALENHERRQLHRRPTGGKGAKIRPAYLNRKDAAAYIGVTPVTFDKNIRGKIKAVRFESGADLFSVAAIEEYLQTREG